VTRELGTLIRVENLRGAKTTERLLETVHAKSRIQGIAEPLLIASGSVGQAKGNVGQ
jgi:hypothetical protein